MNRVCWRLIEFLSRALAPEEREVVRGDLIESGDSAFKALSGVAGLVVRRQASLWKDWRPWAVMVLLLVPLGLLLSIASQITTSESATYSWLYLNNWDWALLRHTEFWYELRDSVVLLFARCILLVCWSWTAGFVLGSVSRRLLAVNGVLICTTLLLGRMFAAPEYLAKVFPVRDSNDPVGGLPLYNYVFPLMMQLVLVAVPCVYAMRQGVGLGRMPPPVRSGILTAAIVTLIAMVMHQPGIAWFLRTYRHPEFWQSREIRVLQNIVYWPAIYLISNVVARRRRMHV